jgi:transcription elongation factor Elf1
VANQGDKDADLPAWILENDGDMGPTLACPHCSFENKDPWEVLDQGRIDEMHCEQCRKPFAFALMECDHCGAEKGFTWPHRPADNTLDLLSCESCGRMYRQPDESPHQEIDPESL